MTTTKPDPADTNGGDGRTLADIDKRLDEQLAQTFPASDPPSAINPGSGEDPKPRGSHKPDAEPEGTGRKNETPA